MGTSKNPLIPKKQHKTVAARTDKSVGAPVKTARGSKRIKPGDGSKPVTKTVGPYMNRAMEAEKADNKRKNSTVARRKQTPKLPKGTIA